MSEALSRCLKTGNLVGTDTCPVGQPVRKVGGDYQFDGLIVAAFRKRSGAVRYVVEADAPAGLLMIYSDKNLEAREP